MEPFASTYDLEARWRSLSEAEIGIAGVKLDDASMILRSKRRDMDAAVAADPVLAAEARRIVCAMVKRSMQAPAGQDGVGQFQQSAGPFAQNLTFANPGGDLYLTKAEKSALGIGGQRAFTVDLLACDESSSDSSPS